MPKAAKAERRKLIKTQNQAGGDKKRGLQAYRAQRAKEAK